MSLEKLTRREALKSMLAGTLGLASTAYSAEPKQPENTPEKKDDVPKYDDFVKLLKEKDKYIPGKDKKLKEFWEVLDEKGKKSVYELHDTPETFFKRYLEENTKQKEKIDKFELSEKKKQGFLRDALNYAKEHGYRERIENGELSKQEIKDLQKNGFLWKVDTENPDLTNRLFFYFERLISEHYKGIMSGGVPSFSVPHWKR